MLSFKHFVRQKLRFLFWTDGLMKWHFEETAKHQSQEDWMACFASDAFIILERQQGFTCAFQLLFDGNLCTKIICMIVLLLPLYRFLSCAFFFLICFIFHRKVVNAILQFVIIICSSSRHLASSKIANNLKSCNWYQLMNNH